jgi:hypothetical protein
MTVARPQSILRLAASIAATMGCASYQIGATLPGKVDLWQPPSAPAARGATPAAPAPQHTLVISPGALAGTGVRETAGVWQNEAALGLELGLYWTRVTPDETVLAGDSLGFSRPRSAFGLNLGWTPSALRSGSSEHQAKTYLELQGRRDLWGLALGVALSPGDATRARTGLQLTPLWGPFYLRVQTMFDGALSLELGVALKVPVLLSFGG